MTRLVIRIGQEVARLGRLVIFFGGYFAYALVVASLWVAWDVLTPKQRLKAGIVALPIRSRTPKEITMIANLISLTPGTLTVTINTEPNVLYVHGMYAENAADFRKELETFERQMLWALRIHDRPALTEGTS
ncbi:Na+/H+ antiporter subunit E [Phytoactinopolyspora limicola]|uniref:Na+/H+ antiporter subunit E n=1 Tax=Phytoactinopolyspora limicola TaxID=2715536 RepID=UPI001408C5EA|nr:Na+/H+ antiporter subunit E [Phytoactinopolyspora limicola]